MRRLALVGSLCTTLLAALPAAGGTILYATAASLSRVDGFCVGAGGGFVPGASVRHADTGGTEPRRLLVANGVLYVGESDRVEVITWSSFEQTAQRRNLGVYESGGWMQLMRRH